MLSGFLWTCFIMSVILLLRLSFSRRNEYFLERGATVLVALFTALCLVAITR